MLKIENLHATVDEQERAATGLDAVEAQKLLGISLEGSVGVTSSIPTQEEFDRASAKMAYRDRNWDEISTTARAKLSDVFDLHEFAIFPNDCEFAAVLFLRTDDEVKHASESGGEARARDLLLDVIRPFRRECPEIKILVELDSHENVVANYEGNYFNRLR